MKELQYEDASASTVALLTLRPAMETVLQTVWTWEEVTKHQSPTDAWVVLDGRVYDITTFVKSHPGGVGVE